MKKKKTTISDVAREMRVSVTTVSFVLNGKAEGRVSPSVIRRVTEYANRIGYKPNPKSQKSSLAKLYGVLVEDISNPLQSRLVFHLEELLQKSGSRAVIMSMNGDMGRGEQHFRALEKIPLEGYVLMSFDNIAQATKKQIESQVPLVMFDNTPMDEAMTTVNPAYAAVLKGVLTKYMATQAACRVGLVTCPSNAHRATEFLNGYMQAMDVVNGDVLVKKVQQSTDSVAVQTQIRDFIRDNRLDAVVFSTDRLARLASEMLGEEPFGVKCVVSTAGKMSLAGNAIQQLILDLDVAALAKEVYGHWYKETL